MSHPYDKEIEAQARAKTAAMLKAVARILKALEPLEEEDRAKALREAGAALGEP